MHRPVTDNIGINATTVSVATANIQRPDATIQNPLFQMKITAAIQDIKKYVQKACSG